MQSAGCAGEMKLADFGLARVFGSPNAGRYTDQVLGPRSANIGDCATFCQQLQTSPACCAAYCCSACHKSALLLAGACPLCCASRPHARLGHVPHRPRPPVSGSCGQLAAGVCALVPRPRAAVWQHRVWALGGHVGGRLRVGGCGRWAVVRTSNDTTNPCAMYVGSVYMQLLTSGCPHLMKAARRPDCLSQTST